MSIEDVRKIIDFHHRSALPIISLLGGEPTLHPEFSRIIDMCIDAGLSIRLFTGGIVPTKAKEKLQSLSPKQLSIITNISAPEHCRSEQEYDASVQSLKDLAAYTVVGYTLFDMDTDPEFLQELVLSTGCHRSIRLGLTMPGPNDSTCLLPPVRYRDAASWILRLARSCDKHDISLGFDCGFTMCMFTPDELGELAYLGCMTRFLCCPIIDVGPDLSVWSCFATSTLDRTHLDEHKKRQDLVDFFTQRQRAYRTFGVYDHCHTCKHKRRGLCAGGCLAHVIRSFSGRNAVTSTEKQKHSAEMNRTGKTNTPEQKRS